MLQCSWPTAIEFITKCAHPFPPTRKKTSWKKKSRAFLNFKSVKCPESGKEKNRKSGIRTFENSRTTGTGRDVRTSPTRITQYFLDGLAPIRKYLGLFLLNQLIDKRLTKINSDMKPPKSPQVSYILITKGPPFSKMHFKACFRVSRPG